MLQPTRTTTQPATSQQLAEGGWLRVPRASLGGLSTVCVSVCQNVWHCISLALYHHALIDILAE